MSPRQEEEETSLGGSQGVSPNPLTCCSSDGEALGTRTQRHLQHPNPGMKGAKLWAAEEAPPGGQSPGGRHEDSQHLLSDSRVFLTAKPDLWARSSTPPEGLLQKLGGCSPSSPTAEFPVLSASLCQSSSHCSGDAAYRLQLLLHSLLLPRAEGQESPSEAHVPSVRDIDDRGDPREETAKVTAQGAAWPCSPHP